MRLLAIILSWSWILLGVWWFFRPAGIKLRFEKRYRKGARWLLLVVLFATAGVLFAVGRKLGGFAGTLLPLLACLAALKGLLFLRGKLSDTVLEWWCGQPTWVYRLAAVALFALGCLIQWILKFAPTTS